MSQLTDLQKLWIGYGLGMFFFLACLVISFLVGSAPYLHVLLCLLGGASGWTFGIMATPLDEDEKTKFSELGKGFLALGSGYVIAKLEDSIVLAAADMIKSDSSTLFIRITLFAICFFVGLLFTLVTRLYGDIEVKRKEKRVARLLAEAEEISESYTRLSRWSSSSLSWARARFFICTLAQFNPIDSIYCMSVAFRTSIATDSPRSGIFNAYCTHYVGGSNMKSSRLPGNG